MDAQPRTPATADATVGVVVIGRNEGQRLVACLQSLQGSGAPAVYVDSGSHDGSAQRARELGVLVVELDPARPFSAARGRNEGFAALRQAHPQLQWVQFLDGDCTLLSGWLQAAVATAQADPQRAVVVGPLQERHADASVYNRLCAMEWRSPPGDISNFGALGGIMLVRTEAFQTLGGFNEKVIAGEDSEFGVRLGLGGWKVTKINQPMATHDADIHRFGQWWKRAVRAGHAIGQRFSLNGRGPLRDCARERRSVLLWGLGVPLAALLLAPFTKALSLLLLLGYAVLAQRISRYRRGLGDTAADARTYAAFLVLGKFAEAVGFLKFQINHALGRYRIIEYK